MGKPEKCYVHRKKQEAFQKRGRQNPCGESVKSVPGTLKGFRKIALGLRSRIGEVDDTSQYFNWAHQMHSMHQKLVTKRKESLFF